VIQKEIHASNTLRVFAAVAPDSDHSRIIVSFANWRGKPSLTTFGAAEKLLEPRKIDAVYVNCAGNHWWQYEDLPLALDAARRFVAPWREIVTYGSSMGGYAAFRYAAPLGATRAVASCPQFSIQRTLMPQEDRWNAELAAISFRHEGDCKVAPGCDYFALYDSLFRMDVMHIDAYKRHVPVTDVPLPCSGHPPLDLLLAYGTVSRVTLELLCGTYQPARVRAEHRAKRRETARYWSELSRRLCERRHYGAIRHACEQAIALSPTKLHLQRAIMVCSIAALRDEVAKYRERLAEIEAAEVAA
jgi:hypothetical protein